MTHIIAPAPGLVPIIRFMVRLEPVRPTRFRENPREGFAWAVTPYAGRRRDGSLIPVAQPVPFVSRARALAWAHQQAARMYGKRGTP